MKNWSSFLFLLSIYYHQNHLCLTRNISNPSTPGFKAMKLQDHLHYTDFKWNIKAKKYRLFYQKKIVDAEEKANENNVDSQEQIRQLTSNENMIDSCEFIMQSLMERYEIAGGLKGNCIVKSICHKNITGDQSYTYLLYFLHLYDLQNLT